MDSFQEPYVTTDSFQELYVEDESQHGYAAGQDEYDESYEDEEEADPETLEDAELLRFRHVQKSV